MLFDLSRGEIILTAVIFAFIYVAGWLPRIARLAGKAHKGGPDRADV